jgi:hypothetical protein
MKSNPTKSKALIKAIENHDYAAAKPLALDLLPALEYSIDFDESPTYWILATITGEIDGKVHPNEFDFAKSVMEKVWDLPSTDAINFIRQGSSRFCEKYTKQLSEKENIEIRNRAINYFEGKYKVIHLGEMITYLLNATDKYALAWEKSTQLEDLCKSEAMLFKSHMLRRGLSVKKNTFDAFLAEIKSVKSYKEARSTDGHHNYYGEYYGAVDDAEFLFIENSSDSSFEMSRNGFIWYATQSKETDPFAVAVRELKSIGALDENKERAY